MITIARAVSIFKEKEPNKRIINVSEWNGKYVFESRDKNLSDDETDWDCSCEVIDIATGAFSKMNGFDMDYIMNSKDVDVTEYL